MAGCSSFHKKIDSALVVKPAEGITPVRFTMSGRRKIRKGFQAHVPSESLEWLNTLFAHEPVYRLEATLRFEDKAARLRCEFREPLALIRHGSNYFLICEDTYVDGRGVSPVTFSFWGSDGKQQFRELSVDQLPAALLYLRLLDPQMHTAYRNTLLRKVSLKNIARAVTLLSEYVKEDPRFCFFVPGADPKTGWNWRIVAVHMLDFFVTEGLVDKKRTEAWGDLVALLEHSRPDDDQEQLGLLCFGLVRLRPKEGWAYLRALAEKLRTKTDPRKDNRYEAVRLLCESLHVPFVNGSPGSKGAGKGE